MTKKQKGFSLIELLIVVAIILIIAAIAIPNLLRSRMAANEASAVGSLRTIVTSQVTFYTTYGIGYAPSLLVLGGAAPCVASSTSGCLVDPVLSAGIKSGYNFEGAASGGAGTASSPNVAFETDAWPVSNTSTGTKSFCADQSGVLRYTLAGTQIGDGAGACVAIPTVLQ
jgi:prepilin-type N-terminal cleavage/methylation domain-containing protein